MGAESLGKEKSRSEANIIDQIWIRKMWKRRSFLNQAHQIILKYIKYMKKKDEGRLTKYTDRT